MEKNIFIAYPNQNPEPHDSANGIKQPTNESKPGMEEPKDVAPDERKKGTVRTTIDFPKGMHKVLRRMLLEEDSSLRFYIINLIEADLKRRGINY